MSDQQGNNKMEKMLALEILASLFAPFALSERDWAEEVDLLIERTCSIGAYNLQPAYSLGQILLKPEFNPQAAAKAGDYFRQMELSLQPDEPLAQVDSEYSLAKELACLLSRAHQYSPSNQDILRALRMISFHGGYLGDLMKTMKIDAEQIHDNRMIAEALLDAGDLEAARMIATSQIQLLNNQRAEHAKALSELHAILGTVYLFQKCSCQSKQYFNQAINLNTSNMKAHQGLINWYLCSLEWEQLKQYISKYQTFFMGSNFLSAVQIICLDNLGNSKKSNEMFEKMKAQILVNSVDQDQLPLYNMCCGLKYFKNNCYEESLHHFKKELLLNKYSLHALLKIPQAAFRIGQYNTSLYYCQLIKERNIGTFFFYQLLQIACYIKLNKINTAMELLSEWEYQNYELPEDHLHFLMGIYNQLGQAEKAIAFINSIPKKSKSTYNSIQMQTLAIFSYNLLGNSQKADEMFHKTFELYQTYTRQKIYFQQFQALYYLIDYSFDHNLLVKGKILISFIHKYIKEMRTINKKVADDMQRQLIQRQRLNNEIKVPYF